MSDNSQEKLMDHKLPEEEKLNVVFVDAPIKKFEKVVLGKGGNSVDQFSRTIVALLEE